MCPEFLFWVSFLAQNARWTILAAGDSRAVPAEDVTPQKRRYTRSLVALSDTDRQLSQLRTQQNKTISDKSM